MPYKRLGKTVYTKSSGKWKKKATAKSVAAAKRMIRLLYGIKHGMVPRAKAKKTRSKKR